jgi:hypothetical protein
MEKRAKLLPQQRNFFHSEQNETMFEASGKSKLGWLSTVNTTYCIVNNFFKKNIFYPKIS